MNFEKFLLGLTFVSIICWLINKFDSKPGLNPIFTKDLKPGILAATVEYIGSLSGILLIVVLFRSFCYEGYRIPSGSMRPTLIEGDCVLVKKYQYGLKLPIIRTKILSLSSVKRGDIVIFWHAKTKRIYIKRVVGLPGDHVKYQDNNLYINSELIHNENHGFVIEDNIKNQLKTEFLMGVNHNIYINSEQVRKYPFDDLIVSKDSYFVMGDNRSNSADSRIDGLIPEKDILGKASLIFFSIDFSNWVVRFDRIWKKLD